MTYILKLYFLAADMTNNQVMITLLSLSTFKYNSLVTLEDLYMVYQRRLQGKNVAFFSESLIILCLLVQYLMPVGRDSVAPWERR